VTHELAKCNRIEGTEGIWNICIPDLSVTTVTSSCINEISFDIKKRRSLRKQYKIFLGPKDLLKNSDINNFFMNIALYFINVLASAKVTCSRQSLCVVNDQPVGNPKRKV
jgi:hypothetical protein